VTPSLDRAESHNPPAAGPGQSRGPETDSCQHERRRLWCAPYHDFDLDLPLYVGVIRQRTFWHKRDVVNVAPKQQRPSGPGSQRPRRRVRRPVPRRGGRELAGENGGARFPGLQVFDGQA
jgi:hypothetical protein